MGRGDGLFFLAFVGDLRWGWIVVLVVWVRFFLGVFPVLSGGSMLEVGKRG